MKHEDDGTPIRAPKIIMSEPRASIRQLQTTDVRDKSPSAQPLSFGSNNDQIGAFKRHHIKQKRYTRSQLAAQQTLNGPIVQAMMIMLVGSYTVLQFTLVMLEDLLTQQEFEMVSEDLSWFELTILILFLAEILANTIAFGIRRYFRDKWIVLDVVIIFLSIFLVVFEIATQQRVAKNVFSVIQIIFRFLRILLLVRKAQSFKMIRNVSQIKTPAEKIIELFTELKELSDDNEMKLDIEYCIDRIGSNKLYEPVFLFDDDTDAADWIKYGATKEISKPDEATTMESRKQTSFTISTARLKDDILETLKAQHDDLYINPFTFHKNSPQGIVDLMVFLFAEYSLLEVLCVNTDCFVGYFTKVWEGYRDNTYHNKIHSFDVTQTSNFFVSKCKLIELADLGKMDLTCLFIAAAIHDYDHPGFNNSYMINSKSVIATVYNDKSVLEAYHVSSSFKLMHSNPQFDIMGSVSRDNYKKMRESIIGIVLATDMAGHFAEISKLKARLGSLDFDLKTKDKQMVLEMVVHACDISNPIKQFNVYKEWTDRLFQEFFHQGDLERDASLPITYLCDKYTTNIAKAQAGFIDFVVRPMMSLLTQVMPEFEVYYQILDTNKAKWGELVHEYESKMPKLTPT